MVTVNKNLESLSRTDVERISNEYLMGWHNLSKTYGFLLKGLNKKRLEYRMEPISKDMSYRHRLIYIRNNYSYDDIKNILFEYMSVTKMEKSRWSGIELFDCCFGRDYAKFFKELLGADVYNGLSEKSRVKKLTETQLDLYGGVGLASETTMKKAKHTLYRNLGVLNPMHSKDVRAKLAETNISLFGGVSPFSSPDVQEKGLMSKLEKVASVMADYKDTGVMDNSIFGQSPVERIVFYELVGRFGKDDVYYQYGLYPYDERYPYTCDFYIKSLDLFIELNIHYTHGGSWFSDLNEDDVRKFDELSKTNTTYTNRYVRTWTDRDVEKRNRAEKENLNYLVFWDNSYYQENNVRIPYLTDFYQWLKVYNCDTKKFLTDYPDNTY